MGILFIVQIQSHLNNWEGGDVICIPVIMNTPVCNCKKIREISIIIFILELHVYTLNL